MYFDQTPYSIQNAGKPYSFTKTGDTYRFEVRHGDIWRDRDAPSERSEISSKKPLSFDHTYTVTYDFMVEPGAANTAAWLNVGQFHGTPDAGDGGSLGPVFAIRLAGEQMGIVTRTDPNATTVGRPPDIWLYNDTTDITRGHWYQMTVEIRFDPDGDGVIKVWRDDQRLASYAGGVGYNDAVGPYWKMGIYRDEAPETLAVNYRAFDLVDGPARSLSIVATDAAAAESDGGTTSSIFTVTRSGDLSGAATADWAVTGTGAAPADAADFGGALPSGKVSFVAGESSKVISVDVAGDAVYELDEAFAVTLSNPSGGLINEATASGSISNDDTGLTIAGTDAAKAEGNSGSTTYAFTVSRLGDLSVATDADWAVTGTDPLPADAADFGGAWPSGQVSFDVGQTSKRITVEVVGDTDVESDEGFTVTLSNPSAATSIVQEAAAGSIVDDDAPSLSLTATDAAQREGDGGSSAFAFTVTRSGDLSLAITADWAVAGSGPAPANAADFGGAPPSGQVSFDVGQTSQLITVEVSGDTDPELDEGFTVSLFNASGATSITQDSATGSILDDDTPPSLSLAATDAAKSEGDSGPTPYSFTVTRSGDLSATTSADWAVIGSGAPAADAADFGGSLPTGLVHFNAGESTAVITVEVSGDTDIEADEGFTVSLSNASGGATISQGSGAGSILDDDAPSLLSLAVKDASKAEGNSVATAFTFTVTRTGDLSTATTADWTVAGSGATAADAADFGGSLPSGQVSFAAGESSQVISVLVAGDQALEPDEAFTVTLSNPSGDALIAAATAGGLITNDDAAPSLSLAATSATKPEGNSGSTAFTFTATRAGDLSAVVTADWAVTGSGAAAADAADFGATLPSGQISFAAGESVKVITVGVAGDAIFESDEGFTVTLSNASGGAVISGASASGSITNDDVVRPPAPSTPDLVVASDTGWSDADNLTNDTTPTFTGTADAASTVRLLEGSKLLGQSTADSTGAWTITSSALSAASHSISAAAVNSSGVASLGSAAVTIVVDTSPPSKASTPDLTPGSDTGRSASDNITNDATPTLQGSAPAGSLVTLLEGSTVLGSGLSNSAGKWSITSGALSDGVHALSARAMDPAGNAAANSTALKITTDSQAITPVITSATATKLIGTAEVGAIVHIFDGASQLAQVTASSSGGWVLSKTFSNAVHRITVTADDKAGNSAGGAGETLLGSSAANSLTGGVGDDRIVGLGGADMLAGGEGDDVFAFGAGFGRDVIADFLPGASSEDRIELSRAMLGLASGTSVPMAFSAVLAKTTDVAGDASIMIDSLNTITLTAVSKSTLDIGDFIFT